VFSGVTIEFSPHHCGTHLQGFVSMSGIS